MSIKEVDDTNDVASPDVRATRIAMDDALELMEALTIVTEAAPEATAFDGASDDTDCVS